VKNCAGPCVGHEGGCNWLDGRVADGRCPHCGGPLTDITTVAALGRLLDEASHGMKRYRVLVTGSRTWSDPAAVRRELLLIWHHDLQQGQPMVVVHGGALGADSYARSWALAMARHGHPVAEERHPADWAKHGRRAGYVRNAEMVGCGADKCLCFAMPCSKAGCAGRPPHDSHGAAHCAAHCAALARSAGIELRKIDASVTARKAGK
jgi:YspA, cpYpsA-related SLOG family